MKNIAIHMPHWIGEFVCALSVISRRIGKDDESITLIVPQHLIPLCTLLTPLPYFPLHRSNRGELLDSIAGVKRQHFDKLYLLNHSLSTAWFGMRTGIPVRRGISRGLLSPFLTETVPVSGEDSGYHITRDYASILEVEDVPPEAWPGVPIPAASEHAGKVVLCPGSRNGTSRQWPGFREIVKLLPSYEFVVLGDENDRETAKSVASHLPHRVFNAAGKTSIASAASMLAAASVVISNHSGLMHLAGYIGVPVVGIFGPTSAIRHRPLGEATRCATAQAECVGCNKGTCSRKDNLCLSSISPGQILELAGSIVRQPA
jgi:heptosyltransferase-2